MIVVEFVLRGQPAEFLARDLDHPVVDREYPGGIVVFMLIQIRVETGQIFAVELEDRLACLNPRQFAGERWNFAVLGPSAASAEAAKTRPAMTERTFECEGGKA